MLPSTTSEAQHSHQSSQEPRWFENARFQVETFLYMGNALRYGIITAPKQDPTEDSQTFKAPLVFVPGLGGSVKAALPFLSGLLPQFDPIVAMDLPGFGINHEAPLPIPKDYLDYLDCFLSHAQGAHFSGKTPSLAGISLGGALSVHWQARRPQQFKQLILIAPAFGSSPVSFPMSFIIHHVWKQLTQGRSAKMTLPYRIEAITRNPDKLGQDPPLFEALTLPVYYMLNIALLNAQAGALCSKIQIPTLMMIPGQDIVCDAHAMAKGFNKIPHPSKQVHHYPDAYHDLLMEPELSQLINDALQWSRESSF